MTHQEAHHDAVADCYAALVDEPEADTCCKRICVMIERMRRDGSRMPHENHLMVLASQLMRATKSFGVYISDLNAHLDNQDYASALRVGRAMVEHETMLHDIAAGKPVQQFSVLN